MIITYSAPPGLAKLVDRAFRAWLKGTEHRARQVSRGGLMRVYWIPRRALIGGALAQATWIDCPCRGERHNHLLRAAIAVEETVKHLTAHDRYYRILHEVGHILGHHSHSPGKSDLMRAVASISRYPKVGKKNRATVERKWANGFLRACKRS